VAAFPLSHSSILVDHDAAKAVCVFKVTAEIITIKITKTIVHVMLEADEDDDAITIIVMAVVLYLSGNYGFFRRRI
jgi:hypothetical protein